MSLSQRREELETQRPVTPTAGNMGLRDQKSCCLGQRKRDFEGEMALELSLQIWVRILQAERTETHISGTK